jgi:hypothetical protein
MSDDEPSAKRVKGLDDDAPEEFEESSDDEDEVEEEDVVELSEESDDDEDEEDDEDDDAPEGVPVGGDVFVVQHHSEKIVIDTEEDLDAVLEGSAPPEKIDASIVAVASSMESAVELAKAYIEATFEEEVPGEFDAWLVEGYEVLDDDAEESGMVSRITIEVHDLK